MKHVVLYITLLFAVAIDHFYQLGRIDEARSNTEQAEQKLTEAYQVADILAQKYERQVNVSTGLRCRVQTLAKANRLMLDRLSETEVRMVMNATLPPLVRAK
jgi:hypothetical protein